MDITSVIGNKISWRYDEGNIVKKVWRTDRQTDIFQYEQTHNMMQVWTGKLSELQLPVQNPAREGSCTILG